MTGRRRRGIVIGFSGHPIPESVYPEIAKLDKLTELYKFEVPVYFDFGKDPETQIADFFKDMSALDLERGINPLSECSERYVILPSLNILSVLLMVGFKAYCGHQPKVISVQRNQSTGRHEFSVLTDLENTYKKLRRKTTRCKPTGEKVTLEV